MTNPRIYADFQKFDAEGFLILTAQGSLRDLKLLSDPKEGRHVIFYSDDESNEGKPDELEVEGSLKFDSERKIWLGVYSSEEFRHASDGV